MVGNIEGGEVGFQDAPQTPFHDPSQLCPTGLDFIDSPRPEDTQKWARESPHASSSPPLPTSRTMIRNPLPLGTSFENLTIRQLRDVMLAQTPLSPAPVAQERRPKGHALLIGLKQVDPAAYGGWDGRGGCAGCELDVDNVERMLQPEGFQVQKLLTKAATRSAVLRGITSMAQAAQPGDLVCIYYSGHGGQQPDRNGDETDGRDETLVAYDGELIDDQLAEAWTSFKAGVRIVFLSDSCNSGTNYRHHLGTLKATPMSLSMLSEKSRAPMAAALVHIGACRDGATSDGYETGGVFTMALCRLWAGGKFAGSYVELHAALAKATAGTATQVAQYNEYGAVDGSFRNQRPFTVMAGAKVTREDLRAAIAAMPVNWLHQPSTAEASPDGGGQRIVPLVAALIGVAVGAGVQLGHQALNKRSAKVDIARSRSVTCQLSAGAIEDLAFHTAQLTEADPSTAEAIHAIVERAEAEARILPMVALCFLVGVTVGANAARP